MFFYIFGVDKSDLCSSFITERWLNCFLSFFERLILTEQKSFKALDLETILDFWKERIVKALDLETIS